MYKAFMALCALILLTSYAQAETCHYRRIAQIDAGIDGSDHLYVPAEIDGHQTRFLLDTGGSWNLMRQSLAKELGLEGRRMYDVVFVDASGEKMNQYVTVKRMKIGSLDVNQSCRCGNRQRA
jgi:predicted aspartyl protease